MKQSRHRNDASRGGKHLRLLVGTLMGACALGATAVALGSDILIGQ